MFPDIRQVTVGLAALFFLIIFGLELFGPSSDPMKDPIRAPHGIAGGMGEDLSQTDPDSVRTAELTRRMNQVRRAASRADVEEENPGAFLEALAQLKTTRDGRTYAPNYKIRALRLTEMRAAGKTERLLPWVERGPGNVSGRARAVIVDASDPTGNTWWIASIGGGVWKTANAGTNWADRTTEMTTLSTTTLVQAQSNPDVFYVGTGMGYGRVVDLEGSGIWKSTDHGETWSQLESTANGELLEAVNRIVVDPNDEYVVLACTNDSFSHLGVEEGSRTSGIFRSIDGGASWTQVFDPEPVFGAMTDNRVQQIVADPTDFNNLYATVNEVGVIKSTDGGITWSISADNFASPSDVGNPPGGGFGLAGISVRTEMAIAPTDPNRLYAAVERPRGIADLYVSKDAGGTWILARDTGNDPNWFNSFGQSGATGAYTAGWFDNTIAVHPYDENVVFVGGVNLYRIDFNPTNNTRRTIQVASGGIDATTSSLPYAHSDHHFLTMIPDDPNSGAFRILDTNDGGVAVSSDGGASWQQFANMGTSQFYGADKRPGGNAYVGGTQDNGTWVSGLNPQSNSTWRHVIGGDGFEAVWNFRDPNLLIGGSQANRLSRSVDGGKTWTDVVNFPSAANRSPFITKLANAKVDPDLVFSVSMDGIIRTDDFGASWTVTPVQNHWLGWRPFDNVEVSNADPQIVWISGRMDVDPASGIQGGVHVSKDGGLSFTEVSNNLPANLAEAAGIATHPTDRNTAYLLFAGPREQKVMRTTDLGQTWEDLSGFGVASKTAIDMSPNGFPDVAAFSLLVMPYDTDILWAGTEIGLFESIDSGQTWALAKNGFPNVAIFELSIVDDQVIAATQGRGVWSVTLEELSGYTPPAATLAPRLSRLAMLPEGMAAINVDLRSPYDSTTVWLDGTVFSKLTANDVPQDTVLRYPVAATKTISVSVTAYRDGRALPSPQRNLSVFPAMAVTTYASDFSDLSTTGDFTGTGFSIRQSAGFTDRAIHSSHPYPNATDATYQLKVPIEVARGNAILKYDDIALVEEGVAAVYTDPNFFDYVIVEGTSDGATWLPLAPGYDVRANLTWLQAYRSGIPQGGVDSQTPGTPSMYVSHSINLLDTFATGDLIFVRFRLHADPLARAWGWAIDNVEIQPNAIVATEFAGDLPTDFRLGQNYPNPFNPTTTIPFVLDQTARVTLKVYDAAGREVRTLLLDELRHAGPHAVRFDASELATGTYLYRLGIRSSDNPANVLVEANALTVVK